MDLKTISPCLTVSNQILVSDIAEISALGFKTIINNRPDNESDDQPLSAALADEARNHDIMLLDIPVIPGELGEADVRAFADAMAESRGPVLAFCRTGTRSVTLWALYSAQHLDIDAILSTTKNAGYELDALRPRFQEVAAFGIKRSDRSVSKRWPAMPGSARRRSV